MSSTPNMKPSKIVMTCVSVDCPERKSVCCKANSKAATGDEGTGHFECSACGKEFRGGRCNAYKIKLPKNWEKSVIEEVKGKTITTSISKPIDDAITYNL